MKVLISRFGAYGDHAHATHLPRLLKEKCGVDYVAFEYNAKGFHIHQNNPFIDEHIHFEPLLWPICQYPQSFFKKRWEEMMKEGGFDKHINLQNSIEYGYIAMEDDNNYYLSSKERREKFGKLNYYDQTVVFAGYPELIGEKGELYFKESEIKAVQGIFEREYKNNFVVIVNLSGTSKHKLFYRGHEVIAEFLDRHPDAIAITMGDEDSAKNLDFKHERVINRAGVYPFRQSMLMTKYANLTIGAESGLMVAATLLGCPTVQLMTAASIKNHGGDFKNDYSLQSPAKCSPCHKGPYDYLGCPTFEYLGIKYPACVKFDKNTIINQMEKVYDDYSRKSKKIILSEVPSLR